MMKKRANKEKHIQFCIPALICAAALLLIEIGIALFVHDRFVRPYGGDILVTVLLCCIWRGFIPLSSRKASRREDVQDSVPEEMPPSAFQCLMPLWVFLFACFVEILQAVDIVNLLGLGGNTFFRIIIGTSFSFVDILCYAVGCICYAIAEKMILQWKKPKK